MNAGVARLVLSAGHVPDLYAEWRRRSTCAPGVDGGVEFGVVVHLELAIKFEATAAGVYVSPEGIETGGEVGALLGKKGEAIAVFFAVGFVSGGALGFFGGVVELEGEDGEAVDDEAGSFGVKGRGGVLLAGGGQEHAVEFFDEIVAALVEGIDGALDVGDVGFGGEGIAGLVFFVPKVEVGAVLGFDDLEKDLGGGGGRGVIGRLGAGGTGGGGGSARGFRLVPA